MALEKLHTYGPVAHFPMTISSGTPGAKRLVHIGVHNSANRNAGDTLLFPVVRRAFDVLIGPFDWELQQAWAQFDLPLAQRLNAEFDGIVIGGGGLLLRDQAGSDVSNSGWQWNSTIAALEILKIPLMVFAIGYNRFRGQADFDSAFTNHIQLVVEKSAFFGIRNTGSINALRRYLTPVQHNRIRRQYCPTTVLWQLYPEYRKLAEAHDKKNLRIFAFNAAFDRAEMRFGKNSASTLKSLASAVRAAEQRGWKIIVAAHKDLDREVEPYLDDAGVSYETANLTDASPSEIMKFYSQVDFAFGMRGHAQMIPFGLRRPIMSIISHDKMKFLLEDINRLDWGVEVNSAEIEKKLIESLFKVESDRASVAANISDAQDKVWEETVENFNFIKAILYGENKD